MDGELLVVRQANGLLHLMPNAVEVFFVDVAEDKRTGVTCCWARGVHPRQHRMNIIPHHNRAGFVNLDDGQSNSV